MPALRGQGQPVETDFMDIHHLIAWGIFLALVLVMLAIDLLVLHRKPHEIRFKEALVGSLVPVGFALLFTGVVFYAYQSRYLLPPTGIHPESAKLYPKEGAGAEACLMFLTGYLVELSLSADNIFLFVVLMAFFRVPRALQHRVLFWGVIGALVMRGVMILAGTALISRFEWILYVFGVFLLCTGAKMIFAGGEPKDPSNNIAVRFARKVLPFSDAYDGERFFVRVNGRLVATTLFLVLICIEFTDLVFALDSIPAIFGITLDPFIVFSSNVLAILGLRSMYFLLAGIIDRFHLLKYGLALVLGFVGLKMILPGAAEVVNHFWGGNHVWGIDKFVSLGVIVFCLAGSIVASMVVRPAKHHRNPLRQAASPRERIEKAGSSD
jgi:tellurite resistance protein TerC